MEGIAKTVFSQKSFFCCFEGRILVFFEGLGASSSAFFGALETGLKIE